MPNTFDDHWNALCVKNPLLLRENATLRVTAPKVKAMLKRAYDAGFTNAEAGKSLFEQLMGKK